MSSFEDFMESCGHDITNFNRNFKVLLDSINARKETKKNLPTNLFKRYAEYSNKVFIKYIN